jgi:hypothetical protein
VGLTVGAQPHLDGVQVKDISLSGISFRMERPIEFMTRLMMHMVFPNRSSPDGQSFMYGSIQCEGAVVRCAPVSDDNGNQYEIAVFFTHLEEAARKAIQDYVGMCS